MHLRSRKIAYAGMMAAVTVLCMLAGSIFAVNTAFLLALASFLAGSVYQFAGAKTSAGFILACFCLGLIVTPQKLYCFTYLGFAVYIWTTETVFCRQQHWMRKGEKRVAICGWVIRGVVYHLLLLTACTAYVLVFGTSTLLQNTWIHSLLSVPAALVCVLLICAEAAWQIFDRAYLFFQQKYGQYLLP